MKIIKIIRNSLITILVIMILLAFALYLYLNSTKPVVKGTFIVKGDQLKDMLEIDRNRWGIPSIKAGSLNDLFWGIGYVHASDRLFQMDMIRRLSTGRLSEVIGERALDTDRYYKDLLIEESIDLSLHNLDADTKKTLNSYCRGINYYIEHESLPPEFKILGYKPEKWKIRDSLSVLKRMETILAESGSELTNFKIASILGKEKTENLISGNNPSTIINGLELKTFYSGNFLKMAFLKEMNNRYNTIGSNNWVISGANTKSGKPILANDPHLPNVFPSNFYQIYANSGKLELSGNTIPGIPFIIIGRNANIGWGLTNVGTDVIDYFILKINPENKKQYLFDGEWKNFTTLKKTIRVKGEKNVIHLIKMSVFGPVFKEHNIFMARHSIGMYPSQAMESVYRMNLSNNLDEFISSAKKFTAPAQNVVFADKKGNIGYYPSGRIPVRSKGNGLFPVPGVSKQDMWRGFFDENKKPFILNPVKGFIVTANNRVLPNGKIPLYSEKWFPSFRAERISELLNSKKNLTVKDNKKIQLDTFMPGAKFLIKKIEEMEFGSNKATFIINQLKKWDYQASSGIAPFLFYRFEHYLTQNIFSDDMKSKENLYLISRHWIYKILGYPNLEIDINQLNKWVDNINTKETESFENIVELSLNDTYCEFEKRGGEKKAKWESIHSLSYKHPLGSVFPLNLFFNRGPYQVSGGNDCIMITAFRNSPNFKTVHLSGFRMVMDFNNFSNSIMINSSGQSGHFMSKFYDDQIKLFTHGKYRKMENFKINKMEIKFIPEN